MRSITERILNTPFLTDGGLETDLIFNKGIDLPHFAAFTLLDNPKHTKVLKDYYIEYLEIAKQNKIGYVLESPTWRANKDWAYKLGYNEQGVFNINQKAIQLLKELKSEYKNDIKDIIISGQIGPREDGYHIKNIMTPNEAMIYHSPQIESFKSAKADVVSAITMTYTEEAIGITLSAKSYKLPVVISFTVETNGKLPNGETLKEAICKVDKVTNNYPAYYMINCAHPSHFISALEDNASWKSRIRGIRANASCKSHQELDESTELDVGNANELAQWHSQLKDLLPKLKVYGGCCGTDATHINAICNQVL